MAQKGLGEKTVDKITLMIRESYDKHLLDVKNKSQEHELKSESPELLEVENK